MDGKSFWPPFLPDFLFLWTPPPARISKARDPPPTRISLIYYGP